jgi:hypothetical protein
MPPAAMGFGRFEAADKLLRSGRAASMSARLSLGWIPFSDDQVTFDGEAFTFDGVRYEPMHLREGVFYPAYGMSGSFNHHHGGHEGCRASP